MKETEEPQDRGPTLDANCVQKQVRLLQNHTNKNRKVLTIKAGLFIQLRGQPALQFGITFQVQLHQ